MLIPGAKYRSLASISAILVRDHTRGLESLLADILVTVTPRVTLPGRGTCNPENCPASEGLLARAARGAFAAGRASKERRVIGWTTGRKQAAGRKQVVCCMLNPWTISRSLQEQRSYLAVARDGLRDVHTSNICCQVAVDSRSFWRCEACPRESNIISSLSLTISDSKQLPIVPEQRCTEKPCQCPHKRVQTQAA